MEVVMKPVMRVLVVVLAAVLVLCSGCKNRFYGPFAPTGYYPKRGMSNWDLVEILKREYTPEKIEQCIKDRSTESRDRIIYARKKVIDILYEVYIQRLSTRKTAFDIGMDFAKLGLTGAVPLVPLADTKSILGGVSTGLMGAQGSINQRIFYEKTMPLLQAKMEADRKTAWKKVEDGLKKPAKEVPGGTSGVYTVEQALCEIEDYYTAGSLANALMSITAPATTSPEKKPEEKKPEGNKEPASPTPATKPVG
jgi:hypothetical protein